ncbi:MAG: peptidylprolyl isomerase [Planctomycetota bacterium]|jgi:cyclophilin family peptidyl-prolyl cis-trans isomerase
MKKWILLGLIIAGCKCAPAPEAKPEPEPEPTPAPKELTDREKFAESLLMKAAEVEVALLEGKFDAALQMIDDIVAYDEDWTDYSPAEGFAIQNLDDSLLEPKFMALLCATEHDAEQLSAVFARDPERQLERFLSDGTTLRSRASYRYLRLTGRVEAADRAAVHMSGLIGESTAELRFKYHVGIASMLVHDGQTEEAIKELQSATTILDESGDDSLKQLRQNASLTLLPALAAASQGDFTGACEIVRLELKAQPEHPQKDRLQNYLERLEGLVASWPEEQARMAAEKDLPKVEMTTDRGRLVITLFEDDAPNTVASFIELVEKGFYDGLLFHRVVPHFVVQGGDPDGTGGGGPGYSIRLEANRKHFRGSLGMARSADPDSAGSQFYFCLNSATATHLDEAYAVFGRVSEGLDVMDQLLLGSKVISAKVLNKRDHEYKVDKLPEVE